MKAPQGWALLNEGRSKHLYFQPTVASLVQHSALDWIPVTLHSQTTREISTWLDIFYSVFFWTSTWKFQGFPLFPYRSRRTEVNTALQATSHLKRVKLLKFTARLILGSNFRSSVERNNDCFLTTARIRIYQFLNQQNKMSPYNLFCFWCYVFALLLVQTNFSQLWSFFFPLHFALKRKSWAIPPKAPCTPSISDISGTEAPFSWDECSLIFRLESCIISLAN